MDLRSTKQKVATISTVKTENVAMSKACVMVLHSRNLLESMFAEQGQATVMFDENPGAVSLSGSGKISPRTKLIDVKFHNVRYFVADGVVFVIYFKTKLQRADILTKKKFGSCEVSQEPPAVTRSVGTSPFRTQTFI